MPRTREFDPELALEQAMGVFWRKGYAETSVDDLVEATGVSRYGLYGTFGDKRGLFQAALGRYARNVAGRHQEGLRRPDASLPDLIEFWNRMRDHFKSEEGRYGCMIACTANELAPHDTLFSEMVAQLFADSREWLVHIFRNAVRKGEVRPDIDPEAAADQIAVMHIGMATLVRGGVDPDRFVRALESVLKGFR